MLLKQILDGLFAYSGL